MVSSGKNSSRSISPSSPQFSIIRRTSRSMVRAWLFMWSPRRAGCAASPCVVPGWRRTRTPLPKIGVMNGYAAALVEVLVGGAEEELVRLRAGQQDHLLASQLEVADVRRTRRAPVASGRSGRCGTPRGGVLVLAAGDPLNFVEGVHGSSGYLSCWRFLGRVRLSGASGYRFHPRRRNRRAGSRRRTRSRGPDRRRARQGVPGP